MKFILAVIFNCPPLVVVIVSLAIYTTPAVNVFTFNELCPPPICAVIYDLIAFCVGIMLSLFAVKYGSVEKPKAQ